ncbi:DUF1722 domain-containing protein [Fictibacillus norfolkensis]|uniref:DUF1722 domain-containing protein n=1 Tax=Fictibacillus norfolkensis TaxID=2762233 RepID=A0ABR8SNV0_9BACL|nr:DUF1722 domain-containing protein [Fictibacillus norfolkensis]MBD7965053.1 DUF1722 domain-containing protein [Fictibacillus norfolkensis]
MKKETEQLWASEKYTVMAKGYNFYKEVQGLIRDAQSDSDYKKVRLLIGVLKEKPYERRALCNTLEHVWGYFKKSAEELDKEHFFSLLNTLRESDEEYYDEIPYEIDLFLQYLLQKYPSDYLSRSTFIQN